MRFSLLKNRVGSSPPPTHRLVKNLFDKQNLAVLCRNRQILLKGQELAKPEFLKHALNKECVDRRAEWWYTKITS